ncbi:MAG: glycosyltransferase [Candidatus Paceibacterota bacterium]
MKIALFIATFAGGGAESVFATLAKEFNARGHNVDLIIGDTSNAVYLHLIPDQVRVINLKARQIRRCLPALIDYLRKNEPDVVLATRAHSCCFAILAKIFSGVKTAVILREASTISSNLRKYPWKKRLLLGFFVRFLYPLADVIIGVSHGVKNDLKEFLKESDQKLYVVYSPIITEDLFVNASQPCNHVWFQHGGAPVILGVGRLAYEKRFDVLIKAFAIVRKFKDIRLLILGEGEERLQLESLVAILKLQKDISLPGYEPNPFKYMSRARLFVMSSDWEGLPGALIQALACGCSVISTDCQSGPREILKNGRMGKLVPVGDINAMALAIGEALTHEPIQIDRNDLHEYTAKSSVDNYLRLFDIVRKT